MNQGLNSEDISNSMIILMFMSLFSNKNEKAWQGDCICIFYYSCGGRQSLWTLYIIQKLKQTKTPLTILYMRNPGRV